MLMPQWKLVVAATVAVAISGNLCHQASAAGEIDLLNPGFEWGDTGGWLDLTPFPGSTFDAILGSEAEGFAYSGDYFGRIETTGMALGAPVKQANVGTVGAVQVQPFDTVKISFAARAEWGIGGVQFAEFFSEKAGGGTSKAEILGGGPLFDPGGPFPTDWVPFEFITTLGSDVTLGVTLQFNAATGGVVGSTSTLDIDDVSITILDGLPGDFNLDNVVDAADYTVWRDNLGLSDAALNGNGVGDASGNVVPADYNLWRSQYGASLLSPVAASATATSAPEPVSLTLLALLLGCSALGQRSARV